MSIWTENSTLADVLAGVRQKTGAAIDAPPAASNERVAVNLGPARADEVLTKLLNGSRFDYIILNAPQQPATVQRVILQEKQGGNAAAVNNSGNNAPAIAGVPQPQQADDNGDVGMPDTEAPEEVQPEPGPASTNGAPPASPDQPGTKTPEQLLEELKRMQQQQQIQQQQQMQQQQIQQQQQQQQQQPPQQQIQPQVQPQMQMQMQPQPPQPEMPPDVNAPPQPEDE